MEKTKQEVLAQQIFTKADSDENFFKALLSVEDAVSAQKLLRENGFDVSLEDVETMHADGQNEISKFKESGTVGELSEEQLDSIPGGGVVRGAIRTGAYFGACLVYGAVCGVCPPAAAGAPYALTAGALWAAAGYVDGKKKK